MKSFTFYFTFNEVSASHCNQTVTAEGSSLNVALSRATTEVMKRPHIKGRRVKTGSIKFWCNENTPEDAEGKD